jgi:DNA processing protein
MKQMKEELKQKKYWIWFSRIKGLGSKRKQKLLSKFQTPEQIYALTKQDLQKVKGIGKVTEQEILSLTYREDLEQYIEEMERNGVSLLTIKDKEYPQPLKEIYDPPIALYTQGNVKAINTNSIAMVGARDCSLYGEKAAYYFSYHLAKQGRTIISGLAEGIDSFSHLGCLAAGGNTIAIMGHGIDQIYPQKNQLLGKQIIKQNGLILSEYPLGVGPERMNFPARNRIISGMSQGVLVIEAKEKSGTMITVDFALEQGRDVYAVPGNINSPFSVGTNRLIQEGAAKMVRNYLDID